MDIDTYLIGSCFIGLVILAAHEVKLHNAKRKARKEKQ